MTELNIFDSNARKERYALHLSRNELADLLGSEFTMKPIKMIESGEVAPTTALKHTIAVALGTTVEDLETPSTRLSDIVDVKIDLKTYEAPDLKTECDHLSDVFEPGTYPPRWTERPDFQVEWTKTGPRWIAPEQGAEFEVKFSVDLTPSPFVGAHDEEIIDRETTIKYFGIWEDEKGVFRVDMDNLDRLHEVRYDQDHFLERIEPAPMEYIDKYFPPDPEPRETYDFVQRLDDKYGAGYVKGF
jgi:transcriptional regulator with XRE-family HTH domain